ncbi:MAG: hypothetical protein ACYC5K_00695 [Saccharofermentanales bacterium]
MRISAIFIATAFEVRMKSENRTLLKQEERFRMAGMLDELDRWINESAHAPDLLVVTCFDELYELCIQRHIKVLKNAFGQISEGAMIRYGILSSAPADAYVILSAGEPRLFKAEIFEGLCNLFAKAPGKIAITGYLGRHQLPIAFSEQSIDPVHSMIDRINGRFSLKANPRNTVILDITDEYLAGLGTGAQSEGVSHLVSRPGGPAEDEYNEAVIIRGGGRVGSAIAVVLFSGGYKVLITETDKPATLSRGVSFAQAVYNTEQKISGITGHLVSPDVRQFEKAWKAGVIPVVIDSELECIRLFDGSEDIGALHRELDPITVDNAPLAYLSDDSEPGAVQDTGSGFSRKPEGSAFSRNKPLQLAALIDCTPAHSGTMFPEQDGLITIGIKGNHPSAGGPGYVIDTAVSSRLGCITPGTVIKAVRVDTTEIPDEPKEAQHEFSTDIYRHVICPSDGQFREIKRIGDPLREHDILGQIVSASGKRTDVLASCAGRLAGSPARNSICSGGSVVAIIDPGAMTAEDCFRQTAIDNAIGLSVLKMLNERTY